MSRQRFILPVNSTSKQEIIQSYAGVGGSSPFQLYVENDQRLAIQIEPVVEVFGANGGISWAPDFLETDTFQVGIGLAHTPPTGGFFTIEVTTGGGSGTVNVDYDASGTALESALNNAGINPECEVVKLGPGAYQIVGAELGVLASTFEENGDFLQPECDIIITPVKPGTVDSRYELLLVVRQAPVAYAEPSDLLPAADVDVSTQQAGSGTSNKIQTVFFTAENTYGGSFTVSATANGVTATCGVATPGMTELQFGAVLAGHPEINYKSSTGAPDNISPKKVGSSFVVTFTVTLGSSSSPSISAENIDLLAPQGVSGELNLNTIGLYRYSLTTPQTTFILPLSIRRTRASGEVKTLLLINWNISEEILDTGSMVPTPRAEYIMSGSDAVVQSLSLPLYSATLSQGTIATGGEPSQSYREWRFTLDAAAANVVSFQNLNKDGFSATTFRDLDGYEMGAIGRGNYFHDEPVGIFSGNNLYIEVSNFRTTTGTGESGEFGIMFTRYKDGVITGYPSGGVRVPPGQPTYAFGPALALFRMPLRVVSGNDNTIPAGLGSGIIEYGDTYHYIEGNRSNLNKLEFHVYGEPGAAIAEFHVSEIRLRAPLKTGGNIIGDVGSGSYNSGTIQTNNNTHLFSPSQGKFTVSAGFSDRARITLDGAAGAVTFQPLTGTTSNTFTLGIDDAAPALAQVWKLRDAGMASANVNATITKATTGDPASGWPGLWVENTFDNTLKTWADGAWRTISTW